jgi:cysteine desulfurase
MPRAIYLDDHATTRCDPAVVDAMVPYFLEHFGNAGSRTHSHGHTARAAVELARARVAATIGGDPREVVFTSGATESDNLAVLGVMRAAGRGHLVVSAIEHKAVLDPARVWEREGGLLTVVPPDASGRVCPDRIAEALRPDTVLVSVMLANNEVGTIQPVAEVAARCRERGVLVHTDAAQAVGKIPVDVRALGVDLLSLSAHKMYGPKGIGALWVRRGRPRVSIAPLMYGGGQERGLRPGTLPVPLIVGFGVACQRVDADHADGSLAAVARRRDRLLEILRAAVPDLQVNGSMEHRLPNNLHVALPGVDAAALMMAVRPIAFSAGSACTSESLEPSYVLAAMGVPRDVAAASFRLGLGRFTTDDDVEEAGAAIAAAAGRVRALSGLIE